MKRDEATTGSSKRSAPARRSGAQWKTNDGTEWRGLLDSAVEAAALASVSDAEYEKLLRLMADYVKDVQESGQPPSGATVPRALVEECDETGAEYDFG